MIHKCSPVRLGLACRFPKGTGSVTREHGAQARHQEGPGSSGTRVKVPLWKVNPLRVSAAPDTETAEVGMRAKEKGRTQN